MDYSEQIWLQCENIYRNLGDEESKLLYRSLFMWRMLGLEDFYKSVEEHDKGRDYGWNELKEYEYFSNPDYRGIVLFGSGQNGIEFYYQTRALGYRVLGFCDNNKNKIGKTLYGLPVFSPETLVKEYSDAFLIVTPSKGRNDIKCQVESMGFNKNHICLPVTGFSCIYNIDPLQYFDSDIVKLSDHEVFIDAGAYDGETTVNFARFCERQEKSYSKIICFEPSEEMVEKCRKTVSAAQIRNVSVIEACVYRDNRELCFDNTLANSGSAAIAQTGEDKVRAVSVDACPECEDATFIKMDIEGAELDALTGAQDVIKRNRPKLAICLYHKTEDIIRIPMFIQSLRSDYKFYIRKYTPHHGEIVLYAV